MIRKSVVLLISLVLFVPVTAQETFYSMFSFDHFIPDVRINDRSASLQNDLYPEWYFTHSAPGDMRWVREHDSALAAFWQVKGDTVLHILCELSGIEWQEREFDIHLVRYFPSSGTSNPLMIPVGGMMKGLLIEAAPTGKIQVLNVIYQLAKRMLDQTVRPRDSLVLGITYHPLMRHSPYRRDIMAMLLAHETCLSILGLDTTQEVFESALWKRQITGMEIFKRHFVNQWILTPDKPLASWIAREPYGSHLVAVTRQPRQNKEIIPSQSRHYVEGLPARGQLGFSVKIDDNGYLVVDTIDAFRLAHACGLRSGDKILTANSARVRNHKSLVEKIYETLDKGGAILQILREDANLSVIIQPMLLPVDDDDSDFDLEEDYKYPTGLDSIFFDSGYKDSDQ